MDQPIAKPEADSDDKLKQIMQLMQKKLDLHVKWDAQGDKVFTALRTDFMKNVTAVST